MSHFWHYARQLLHYRGALAAALMFAVLSGATLGIGLMSLLPVLNIVLGEADAKSLPQLAEEFNAAGRGFEIPQGVIDALPVEPFGGVALIIIALIILTVIGATFNFLHLYLSATVCTRAVAAIRADAFRRVIAMPLTSVFKRGPSQLVARVLRDTSGLQSGFESLLSKAVSQVAKGAGSFIAAFVLHPGLTLLALVVVPGLVFLLRKLGKRVRKGTWGMLEAHAQLLQIASEAVQGLRAVKASTGEERSIDRFGQSNRQVVRNELRVRFAKAVASPLLEVVSVAVIGGLALFAVHLILQGTLGADRFFLTLGCLAVAGASLRPLAGLYNELQAAAAPASRLVELQQELGEDEPAADLAHLPRHHRSLEIESVTFTYPDAERPALLDVTLRIVHGERVAIVGPNGSGKTTLLSLVPRLIAPDAGAVRIDGIDIRSVSLKSLRGQIGVVTQETVLFHCSIAENIAFGVPPEEASREKIIEAAQRAHADEFIRQIPGGYNANLLEHGASLSGGQRQRLAIARAIMRDPSILILDEATSQIDAESETHINAALKDFCKGRTALIIAHRLSTVLNADRIVVMDGGRVVDQGTHEQLMSRCDLYARLSHTQLAGA